MPASAVAEPRGREGALDAARVVATGLVVLHHTAIAYGAIGGWYWRELTPDESWPSRLLVFFCSVNQAWFMGLFFLLAGFHSPAALRSRGAAGFLRARWQRLGWPLLLYIALIGPLTIALARTARGAGFTESLLAVWRAGTVEIGPLWFCWALLLLALTSVALVRVAPAAAGAPRPAWVPSERVMWAAVALTALGAFALRLAWPVGTTVMGLQLGYFASYLVLYGAGWVMGQDGRTLADRFPELQQRRWRRIALYSLPLLPLSVLLGPRLLGLAGRPEGGFNALAAVYALWEPLVAWGAILTLLAWGRRAAARAPALWAWLAGRAFGVFMLHPPVVVGVTLALRGWPAPSLVKWMLSSAVASLLTLLLADRLKRLPGLRRLLA